MNSYDDDDYDDDSGSNIGERGIPGLNKEREFLPNSRKDSLVKDQDSRNLEDRTQRHSANHYLGQDDDTLCEIELGKTNSYNDGSRRRSRKRSEVLTGLTKQRIL